MTGAAFLKRVGSHQGESIVVVANGLNRNLPASHRVALGTIGTKLAAMNIRVAAGTIGADILEDQAGVAAAAVYIRVHSAQWIVCLIVIEFRNPPDGLPT